MSRIFSAAERAEIMSKYKSSGLNIPAYSRENGISETTLYKWQKREELLGQSLGNKDEFIELGAKPEPSYEIRRGEVILKIPARESVTRIAEIFKSLN
jgi:transposase-like protein